MLHALLPFLRHPRNRGLRACAQSLTEPPTDARPLPWTRAGPASSGHPNFVPVHTHACTCSAAKQTRRFFVDARSLRPFQLVIPTAQALFQAHFPPCGLPAPRSASSSVGSVRSSACLALPLLLHASLPLLVRLHEFLAFQSAVQRHSRLPGTSRFTPFHA